MLATRKSWWGRSMLCDYVVGSQRQHVRSHCWHAGCAACVQHACSNQYVIPTHLAGAGSAAAGLLAGRQASARVLHRRTKLGVLVAAHAWPGAVGVRGARLLQRQMPSVSASELSCICGRWCCPARKLTSTQAPPEVLLPATTHLARGAITLPGLAGGRCAGPGGDHTAVRAGVTHHADALAVGGGVARDLRAREGRRAL